MRLLRRALLVVVLIGVVCGLARSPQSGCELLAAEPQVAGQGLPEIAAMKGTGTLSPPEDPERFTFVVFGDNRPASGEPQPDTIVEIFAEIRARKPAFALSLGDIIEGKPDAETPAEYDIMRRQFRDFLCLAEKATVPIFNAPGNHEMDDHDDIPSEQMHKLYRQYVAPTYGAFTYGNSRFICLNTEDVPPPNTPPPPADEEFSYMSPLQHQQLKADLDANRDKAHIFIAMHYPIHAQDEGPPATQWDDRLNPTDRKALTELFANYKNIAYVLAAHEHLYFNPADPDNITDVPAWKPGDPTRYLISGGAGAPLNDGKWGFYHYLVFTVDGDNVSVTLHKLKGTGASK